LLKQLKKKIFISPDKRLPGNELKLPHVLLENEACSLKEYIMRTYSRQEVIAEEAVFNYRFFRAHRTAECSLRILRAKLRILKEEREVSQTMQYCEMLMPSS
jgi:hypothetical protein